MEEILVENSTYCGGAALKSRLINGGYMENVCMCCGINTWNNKKISLQIHHVNGINNDNRIENLQLLCPNCHSQTVFFGGKAKRERHRRQLKKMKEEAKKAKRKEKMN